MPKLPDIPDIPGKSLIGGTTKRARVVAAAGAGAALAVGGVVAKRVLGHGGKDEGAKDSGANGGGASGAADLAGAEADAKVVPIAKEKAPPKPKPAKPKAAKPKPKAAPKAATAKAAPVKPKADDAKPPKAKVATKPKTAAPKPKPDTEPGNRSHDKGPHQALNNPVGDPDETEYPDPFETRPDPRDPVDPDGAPFGEEPHPVVGSGSTSEPRLENDPEHPEGGRPPRRENLDQ
ncbi:MAG TPA: hypothetical protein VGC32_01570 [Solirubrobacterales bacterium]